MSIINFEGIFNFYDFQTDQRPWIYKIEQNVYHPYILKVIKNLRRFHRNEEAISEFRKDLV